MASQTHFSDQIFAPGGSTDESESEPASDSSSSGGGGGGGGSSSSSSSENHVPAQPSSFYSPSVNASPPRCQDPIPFFTSAETYRLIFHCCHCNTRYLPRSHNDCCAHEPLSYCWTSDTLCCGCDLSQKPIRCPACRHHCCRACNPVYQIRNLICWACGENRAPTEFPVGETWRCAGCGYKVDGSWVAEWMDEIESMDAVGVEEVMDMLMAFGGA